MSSDASGVRSIRKEFFNLQFYLLLSNVKAQ